MKDVVLQRVLQDLGAMWQIGRNDDDITSGDKRSGGIVLTAPEAHRAANYEGELFIFVSMQRDQIPLAQTHLADHHLL
jgi:hypothetical protein